MKLWTSHSPDPFESNNRNVNNSVLWHSNYWVYWKIIPAVYNRIAPVYTRAVHMWALYSWFVPRPSQNYANIVICAGPDISEFQFHIALSGFQARPSWCHDIYDTYWYWYCPGICHWYIRILHYTNNLSLTGIASHWFSVYFSRFVFIGPTIARLPWLCAKSFHYGFNLPTLLFHFDSWFAAAVNTVCVCMCVTFICAYLNAFV